MCAAACRYEIFECENTSLAANPLVNEPPLQSWLLLFDQRRYRLVLVFVTCLSVQHFLSLWTRNKERSTCRLGYLCHLRAAHLSLCQRQSAAEADKTGTRQLATFGRDLTMFGYQV